MKSRGRDMDFLAAMVLAAMVMTALAYAGHPDLVFLLTFPFWIALSVLIIGVVAVAVCVAGALWFLLYLYQQAWRIARG